MIRRAVMSAIVAAASVSTPAAAQDVYGAIAYGPHSGEWGYSDQSLSLEDALDLAMARCGGGCAWVGWFRNSCGALAVADGLGWGADWGDTKDEAASRAMALCAEHDTNTNCTIQFSTCTPN